MNFPVFVLSEAALEAIEAADSFERKRSGLADDFHRDLDHFLCLLSHYPEACQRFRGPLRRGFLSRFHYTTVYCIHDGIVVVVAITPSRFHPDRLVRHSAIG
jgi:hypothetical protein